MIRLPIQPRKNVKRKRTTLLVSIDVAPFKISIGSRILSKVLPVIIILKDKLVVNIKFMVNLNFFIKMCLNRVDKIFAVCYNQYVGKTLKEIM